MPKGKNKHYRKRIETGEKEIIKGTCYHKNRNEIFRSPERLLTENKQENLKKLIITDLVILAHKQRCTRDARNCQRE